jgi:hypothetical protein
MKSNQLFQSPNSRKYRVEEDEYRPTPDEHMRLTFMNTGNGNSIVVQAPLQAPPKKQIEIHRAEVSNRILIKAKVSKHI